MQGSCLWQILLKTCIPVTDLIRDKLTSLTLRRNAIAPEMDVITTLTTLTYLATGDRAMIWVCYSTFRTVLCRCSFFIKYVKYDSMVNKEYNVCVCARAREREYGKTGKITLVISKWRLIINPTLKSALTSFLDNQPITVFKRLCHS